MTTNRIQQAVRICVLSTFLALAAFSFFVFGSASAHALTQTTSTTTATVVRIVVNQQGESVFSPGAITVTSGATVRIVNKTQFTKFFSVNGQFFGLNPGAAVRINPTQSGFAKICGGGALTITVV